MSTDHRYASRGGLKLAHALQAFAVDARAAVCADLGSHAGGFVDCLLQHGAARVYAVDPGYGVLDYRLRRDPRVVVCERTNAMHWRCPEPCALVTIDVGWTPQRRILPAALRLLAAGGRAITLIKPHYEADRALLRGGVLPKDALAPVLAACREDVAAAGWKIEGETMSPMAGHGGNAELLWLLTPA